MKMGIRVETKLEPHLKAYPGCAHDINRGMRPLGCENRPLHILHFPCPFPQEMNAFPCLKDVGRRVIVPIQTVIYKFTAAISCGMVGGYEYRILVEDKSGGIVAVDSHYIWLCEIPIVGNIVEMHHIHIPGENIRHGPIGIQLHHLRKRSQGTFRRRKHHTMP